MKMINTTSSPLFLAPITRRFLGLNWRNRVVEVITTPPHDEICFYLRQAIETCYNSRGSQLPNILNDWCKMGIKIDFSVLPDDIQDGIAGIIMQSSFGKTVVTKIVINIPQFSSVG